MSAGQDYQFVDTNVLIYAHDTSAGAKRDRAVWLLEELWESRSGCLSVQVFQEFYVNITRKVAHPLESSAAAQILADLSVWRVHAPDVATCWQRLGFSAAMVSRFGMR